MAVCRCSSTVKARCGVSNWTKPIIALCCALLCALLVACDTGPKPPIHSAKMVQVLTAIHLAESEANHDRAADYRMRDSVATLRYQHILHQQGVSIQAFHTSYQYYLNHLDTFNAIYLKVNEEIAIIAAQRDATLKREGQARKPKK